MRRCSNCGATPPEDARFCPRCGAPLGADDALIESCEILLWRGYTRSEFIAVCGQDAEILSRSRPFRWRKDEPPPEEEPYLSAHAALVESLVDQGWAVSDEPDEWYALSFTRRWAARSDDVVPDVERRRAVDGGPVAVGPIRAVPVSSQGPFEIQPLVNELGAPETAVDRAPAGRDEIGEEREIVDALPTLGGDLGGEAVQPPEELFDEAPDLGHALGDRSDLDPNRFVDDRADGVR
jgi:hypothetical protein